MAARTTFFSLLGGTIGATAGSIGDPHFRGTDSIFDSCTDSKVKRIVTYALSGLVTAAALSCPNENRREWGIGGLLIAGTLATVGALFFNDYDDAKEREQIRTKASDMSWEELTKKYDLHSIVKKEVVPKDELRKKFEETYKDLPLTEITKKHPLSLIREYQLACNSFLQKAVIVDLQADRIAFLLKIDLEELNGVLEAQLFEALKNIKTRWTKQAEDHIANLAILDATYPNRLEKRDGLLKAKEQQIESRLKDYETTLKDPEFHPDSKTFAQQLTQPGICGGPTSRRTVAQERNRLVEEFRAEKHNTSKVFEALDDQYKYNSSLIGELHKNGQKETGLLAELNALLARHSV